MRNHAFRQVDPDESIEADYNGRMGLPVVGQRD